MKYFNGFCLSQEEELFSKYTLGTKNTVVGFSFGAQKAFEYVYESTERIDRLILLSPAFFQTQKDAYIRTQLRYFELGKEAYIRQFLRHATYPSNIDLEAYFQAGSSHELKSLLTYTWDKTKILNLLDRGVIIEVFLGGKDKIIDSKEALSFFSVLTICYYCKNSGHLLQN